MDQEDYDGILAGLREAVDDIKSRRKARQDDNHHKEPVDHRGSNGEKGGDLLKK